MPVRLDDFVGMGPARPMRGELAVGQDRQFHVLAGGLADPLVLIQRGDATGVVPDHQVGTGLPRPRPGPCGRWRRTG